MYKLQNSSGAEPEIENADKIQLPYTTKQRVVIFGGHATWLKAIKPMLPNVKFIDPYTKPDANLIRHADVVWVQTNAMPHSFYGKIMEIVRKGNATKLLTEEHFKAMRDNNVPEWYIDSCMKIQYMFPKAHAAAYMISTLRLGWYKVHKPVEYYAAYFTVRSENLDGVVLMQGHQAVKNRMKLIKQKQSAHESSTKEDQEYATLQIVNEMLARKIEVLPVDIYKSEAKMFKVEDGKIRLPFSTIPGLGESAAISLAESGKVNTYLSIEEMQIKTKVSKSIIESLKNIGALEGLPESSQMSLF